jgi:regulator of cell morphogenesis and NO signaling
MEMPGEGTTVRELVVQHPETRAVLERLGMDYCCGGERPLAEAAAARGLSLDELSRELEQAGPGEGSPGRDWAAASPTELADHIERRHHSFMREQLPRIAGLIGRARSAHAEAHGEMLGGLAAVFGELKDEIQMHLMKEEQVLFPFIRQMEAYGRGEGARPHIHCITVQNPVGQMRLEHEHAGQALARMRELTRDFKLPHDACPTFRALYEALQVLEADLREHIHLENNILFPRALELEEEALGRKDIPWT